MHGHHGLIPPEPTITTWGQRLPEGCSVLDVAAGGGRHALWFAERGHQVTALDRETEPLRSRQHPSIRILTTDLESAPWPLPQVRFDAVVVVNYLWRPLLPTLIASVAVDGYLMYETFAVGNEAFGRPRNPDFLLRPDELRLLMPKTMRIHEFWQGEVGQPTTAVRQRLLAQRTQG